MGRHKKLPTDGLTEEQIVHLVNIPSSSIVASGDSEYIKKEYRWWVRNGYASTQFAIQTFDKLMVGPAVQTWITKK